MVILDFRFSWWSFILLSVLWQDHSLVHEFSTECDLVLPLSSLKSSGSCLRVLPLLPVTSLLPSIFPSTTCFRRHFLCKMWPVQLVECLKAVLVRIVLLGCNAVFAQSFCPSSGVLSRTSALVHFMQLWPFATRSRMEEFYPATGSKRSSKLQKCTKADVWLRTPDDGQKDCPKHVES